MKSALAAVALLIAAGLPAHSVPVNDGYYGGTNTYTGNDVIGSTAFDITSADVTRSGPGNGTLTVVIHTNYAGVPGTTAAEGTGYGSLFFSTSANGGWSPTGSAPYPTDQYVANDWNYAFTMPTAPNVNTGNSALYAIGSVTGSPTTVGPNNVVQSYTTQNGTIYMSNVNGNPITYPGSGNPGFYFREGQAVQYVPGGAPVNANTTGTWTVDAALHTITFSFFDGGILGNDFALAWAMTCANDVIQGSVLFPQDQSFTTPLPAAVWLFGSVLAGGAGFGRWRKAKKTRMSATGAGE